MLRSTTFVIASLTLLSSTSATRADDAEGKALNAIEKLGGKVVRNEKADGKPVVAVVLWNTRATDEDLKHLAAFPQLEQLNLRFTQVTDAGLKDLAMCKHLHDVRLSFTMVTDQGLKELANLKQLQTLCLAGTKVTDAGLKEVAALKQLQTLYTVRSGVTEEGLQELQKALPKCKFNP